MLAEAKIILRCFCRLDQIQIPKLMAESMNKKGSLKWVSRGQPQWFRPISVQKTQVGSKELLCNGLSQKATISQSLQFLVAGSLWLEQHSQPHVLLGGCVGKWQCCRAVAVHSPGHQVLTVPALQVLAVGTRGERGVGVYTNVWKGKDASSLPITCRTAGAAVCGEWTLRGAASQHSRGHFLATAR